MLSDISVRTLLNTLDGVSYLVDTSNVIVAVGEPAWTDSNSSNGVDAKPETVIGRDLLDFVSGHDVKHSYRRMHEALVLGSRRNVNFEYRCDAPDLKRVMRMSMSPVRRAGMTMGVLYQSQILAEVERPWMSLFDRSVDIPDDAPTARLCSYCHCVAWPMQNVDPSEQIWIAPEEYYMRGGPSEVRPTHGICPTCYTRILGDLAPQDDGFAPMPYRQLHDAELVI